MKLGRREFLGASAALLAAPRFSSEKLNVGVIGVSGRGGENLQGVSGENVVALCDVDDRFLAKAAAAFPAARTYRDFREMLQQKELDAVVVSTPDHVHAPATAMALKLGKHVYCEKPLTHSVHEARLIQGLAGKLATQMGTQIHAGSNYRRAVELIQKGAIGKVREVHVFLQSGGFTQKTERPKETPAAPKHLDWNLWLGPAPERPYHPDYHPFYWRGWWDFGGGRFADMACHYMDLPFWALGLKHPRTVEAEGPPPNLETAPDWQIVRYQFDSLKLVWYHGGKRPEHPIPKGWPNGVLFLGEGGELLADYSRHVVKPEVPPPKPFIADSIGHHAEWIRAAKTGAPTTCHFGYSGPLAETVLMGNVAYRAGRKIDWDKAGEQAPHLLRREYRKGWAL